MGRHPSRGLLVGLILVAVFIVVGLAEAEGRYNKAAFEKVMEKAYKNVRILVGSLIAEDWKTVESVAEELVESGSAMRELTPKVNIEMIDQHHAYADSLSGKATLLASSAADRNRAASAAALGKLIGVCMDCHSTFRK